jgi:Leucine-rich repeat (LRR) protein
MSAGAVASTGGSQYGKASGRSSRASASRSNAAAIAAGGKTTGLDDIDDAQPSATRSLLEFENDLAAKNRTSSTQSTVIEPGGRRRRTPTRTNAIAVAGGTAAFAAASSEQVNTSRDISQFENEVLSKPRQESRSTMDNDVESEPLVSDSSEPENNDYMDSFAVNEPFSQYAPASSNGGPGNRNSLLAAQVQNTSTSGEGAPQTEQPAEVYPGVDFASQDFANEGAVEAFVADNVVDAMGVAVVMSEEEENQIERRKYKKYLILAFICMVLIAVAIVVPVVLVVGKVEPAAPSAAPSMAPSLAPSSAPTSVRLTDTIDSLKSISNEDAFNDVMSPQYQAAQWVSDEDPLALPIGDAQFVQRYILAVFYFSTNGDEWDNCGRNDPICGGDPDEESWLSEASECVWVGLNCTNNANVDQIFFARTFGNNLDGTLPQELTFLSSLGRIILQNNVIRGTIPEWLGDISLLNTLILSGNPMEGTISPMMLLKSEFLGTIHLSRGGFNGTIPSELASLPLADLRLDENDFSGAIPTELGSIASLRVLELQSNKLTEVLPLSLFNLANLVTFRVNDNKLLGTIPATISQMTNLTEIWMNATSIGGTLPESLYTLPKLTNLNLGGSDFSGTLSEGVGSLSGLRFLKIEDNRFSGPLPVSLNNLTRLNYLLIQGNDLTGTISTALCDRKGANFFDLQNLTADCKGSPPQVVCPEGCCDVCLEG